MNLLNKKSLSLIIVLFVSLVLSGCGASGSQFTDFTKPSKNKSMIYIYRPFSTYGAGLSYSVYTGNKIKLTENDEIGYLRNNGYIYKEMSPGENIQFKADYVNSVSLDLKPNEIYCIKGATYFSWPGHAPSLTIVNKSICENEIKETHKSFKEDSWYKNMF